MTPLVLRLGRSDEKKFSSKDELISFLKKGPLEKRYFLFYERDVEPMDFDFFFEVVQSQDTDYIALKIEENTGDKSLVVRDTNFLIREKLAEDHVDCYKEAGLCFLKAGLIISALELGENALFPDSFLKSSSIKGMPIPRLAEGLKRPALFLDRDGVINKDSGYVGKKEEIHFLRGIPELIKFFNLKKWWVIVLTNQSGVARGLYSPEDVSSLHHWMGEELLEQGAKVDDWLYCPFHYEKAVKKVYRKRSLLRKPHPGMLIKASEKHPICLEKSIMIGDKKSDQLQLEGIRYFLLQGNYSLEGASAPCFSSHETLLNHFRTHV